MNFPLYIARGLRLTSSGEKANTTGIIIAVAGVALAIMVMEITLGVVMGFKQGITEKLTGFEGQVVVQPAYDYDTAVQDKYIPFSPELRTAIKEELPEASASLKMTTPGLLKTDTDFAGVYFTARDASHPSEFEKSCIVEGEFPDFGAEENASKIVLSQSVASSLNLKPGDKINVCFFINDAVRLRKFELAGLYESGFSEYDATVAFASLSALQRLAGVDSITGSAIELNGLDIAQATQAAEKLQGRLLADYRDGKIDKFYPVDNINHTGAVYLSWLSLLDTNVVVIFILMLCVAAFMLVSSMFILILERIPTIGILRAMGASRRQVRSVFIYMALRVVGIGLLIGNVLGLGVLFVQKYLKVIPLDAKMYYLHYVPIEISPWAIVALNIGAVVVAWLILIVPSSMAARISPAVTVRYE